jgi:hypothetical protein
MVKEKVGYSRNDRGRDEETYKKGMMKEKKKKEK